MARLSSMEMAAAIAENENITVKKSFLGIGTKVVYEPTQSAVELFQYDYSSDNGDRIRRILSKADGGADVADLMGLIESVAKAAMGPFRLEGCVSADRRFLMLQPFGFSDFQYKPLAEPLVIG